MPGHFPALCRRFLRRSPGLSRRDDPARSRSLPDVPSPCPILGGEVGRPIPSAGTVLPPPRVFFNAFSFSGVERNRRTALERHKGREINAIPQGWGVPRGAPCGVSFSRPLPSAEQADLTECPVFNPSPTPQEANSPDSTPPCQTLLLPSPPLSREDPKPPNHSFFSPKTGTTWDFEHQGKAGRVSHCHLPSTVDPSAGDRSGLPRRSWRSSCMNDL